MLVMLRSFIGSNLESEYVFIFAEGLFRHAAHGAGVDAVVPDKSAQYLAKAPPFAVAALHGGLLSGQDFQNLAHGDVGVGRAAIVDQGGLVGENCHRINLQSFLHDHADHSMQGIPSMPRQLYSGALIYIWVFGCYNQFDKLEFGGQWPLTTRACYPGNHPIFTARFETIYRIGR